MNRHTNLRSPPMSKNIDDNEEDMDDDDDEYDFGIDQNEERKGDIHERLSTQETKANERISDIQKRNLKEVARKLWIAVEGGDKMSTMKILQQIDQQTV